MNKLVQWTHVRRVYYSILYTGTTPEPPKFEHIIVAVITFFPFFCADTFDTSLLIIVYALR